MSEANDEVLEFSGERTEKPFKVSGQPYKLVELDGIGLGKWMNILADRARERKAGKNTDRFVTDCLVLCVRHPDDNKVPFEVVQGWPAKTQLKLFDLAEDMNGLNEEARQAEKNG